MNVNTVLYHQVSNDQMRMLKQCIVLSAANMLTMTMIIFLVKFNILSNISYIITIADMTTNYMSLIIIIITFKPLNNQTILLRNSMQFLILVLMIIGLIISAAGCETNLIIRFTTSTGRLLIYILVYTISLEVTLPLMVKID